MNDSQGGLLAGAQNNELIESGNEKKQLTLIKPWTNEQLSSWAAGESQAFQPTKTSMSSENNCLRNTRPQAGTKLVYRSCHLAGSHL